MFSTVVVSVPWNAFVHLVLSQAYQKRNVRYEKVWTDLHRLEALIDFPTLLSEIDIFSCELSGIIECMCI